MTVENLNRKTIKGLLTMSVSSGVVFIIQIITTTILARIFTPTQFGIVSAVTIITSYTDIFWRIGIGPAIVQKKDLNSDDINTGFTTSVIFGTIATILVVLFSSSLIKIINIENSLVLNVIALSFIINSFGVVPLSILQREMHFTAILKKDVLCSIVYAITALILGVFGFGVWALVIALLIRYIINTIFALYSCPSKARFGFKIRSFKSMIKFGFGFSISQFLSVTTNQSDYFVVSNKMGSYALGIYSKAYQLMTVPANLFGQVLDQVFFPAMSKIQNNDQRLSDIYILSSALLALVYFPVGVCIYLFSDEIILILLGSEWLKAAAPLKVLSLSLFFRVGYKINDPLFRAKGAVYDRAIIHLMQAVATILASFIGVRWGLVGVSVGVLFSLILNFIVISIKTYKLINFDISKYIYCVLPVMVLNGGIILVMKYIMKMLKLFINNGLLNLVLSIGIFCIFFLLLVLVIYFFVWPESIKSQLDRLLKTSRKRKK